MRIAILMVSSMWSCLWILFSTAAADPLPVQNRFPLHLMFLAPRPVSVSPPPAGVLEGALAVDYSSIFVDERNSRWEVLMDMELAVVDLSFVYGITDRAAIRLVLPWVNMGGGFMDGFLESYHDSLGLANYGREKRPENSFAYNLRNSGSAWLEGDSGGLNLADITVSGQWAPLTLGPSWHASMLVSVKLPTGEARHGFGSGAVDAGIFVPTQYESAPWSIFIMPGYIWHSDPDTLGADVTAQPSFSFLFGAAYASSEKWQWIAQLNYFSSPIDQTGIAILDDGAVELALGFRHAVNPNWRIEFAFCEDLFTLAAPDFTFHLGVVRSFGFGKHNR